jgi:chemotaxis protein methyltransferase CheR
MRKRRETMDTMPAGISPPPSVDIAAPALHEQEFALFQTLIHREAGIYLSEAKHSLLVARLSRRLRELGLRSFRKYYDLVTSEAGEAERARMFDCISTNETSFFREPHHFEFIEREVIPRWIGLAAEGKRERCVRVWSAGCATGEEPYTLAMVLLSRLPPSAGWHIRILATDLSNRALARARQGLWPLAKASDIPEPYLKAFMLRGVRSQEGKMKAGPEIRSVVEFAHLNLNSDSYPLSEKFDLIFCRNVLIYFHTARRARTTSQIIGHLEPDGYLFLGHAETLHHLGATGLATVIPTVYSRPSSKPDAGGKRGRRTA